MGDYYCLKVQSSQKNILIFYGRTEIIAINIQLEISELDLEKAAAYAERFFLYVDHGNPIMNILFDVAVKRTALKFAEGWEAHELDPRIATNNDSLSDIFLRDEGNYKDLVKHEESIASFPDIYFRLKEVLHADCSDAKAIAAIINTDPGLSSKLLKLVNSSFLQLAYSRKHCGTRCFSYWRKRIINLSDGHLCYLSFQRHPSRTH